MDADTNMPDGWRAACEAQPVKVGKVEVRGANVTNSRLIVPEVSGLLDVSSFPELVVKCDEARRRLYSYGVFESVKCEVDVTDEKFDQLELVINVKEKGRRLLHFGVESSTNEVLGKLSGRMINLFGGAESLDISANIGHARTASYEVTFTKPLSYQTAWSNVYLSLYRRSVDQIPSKHMERTIGTSFGVKIPTRLGQYSCGYMYDWRTISGMAASTPLGVRLAAGHTVKSSVQHSIEMGTQTSFPGKGVHCLLTQELAGLGGDVRFLKTDGQLQLSARVPRTPLVVSTSLQGGAIATDKEDVPIADRFFLGGAQSVRGYRLRGLGPRDGDASLGGRAYAAGGVHVFSPLPYISSDRFRLHAFVTGGSLLPNVPSLSLGPSHMARQFRNQFAWSYGVGLAVDVGLARIEFNYCFPRPGTAQNSSSIGLHVGFGNRFL